MLAGCGLGNGAASLSADDRARWRRQARDWLNAEITAQEILVDTPAATRPSRSSLLSVRDDPEYSLLRDAAQWSKFDADEQAQWLSLWRDIDRLLARIDSHSRVPSTAP